MTAPDAVELEAVEALALELAREAGAIVERSLRGALEITYKTEPTDGRPPADPVSEIDHAVEALVRERVRARFPAHGIIGEEVDDDPDPVDEWAWVIDPVDGTANFINGFPLFAVSIGVLHDGRPMAGAIWCSTTHALRPGVYHARRGGGLRFDGAPHEAGGARPGVRRRLSGAPGGSSAGTVEWDHRVTGSAAIEIAYVAAGAFASSTFMGLRIWDLAAGVLLCLESGREAWVREGRAWRPFERFTAPERLPPGTPGAPRAPSLRDWRQPMIVGTPDATALLRERVRFPGWRQRLRWRMRRWRRRLRGALRPGRRGGRGGGAG